MEFRTWHERVALSHGVIPDTVIYTRKSTEETSRQARSHEQQLEEILKKFPGDVPGHWRWRDNMSGTSFERPGFQDLLSFCHAHPRSKKTPGRVLMYDPSRFGRKLDEEGEPDLDGFVAVANSFKLAGWQLHFVTLPRVGDSLADLMSLAVHANAAALFSKNLSSNVKRGRIDHSRRGYWTAGAAPWGTVRLIEETERVLERGEKKGGGGGGAILGPDPKALEAWSRAARLLLDGASLNKIGAMLMRQEGLLGAQGKKLGHRAVKNLLTNRVLIGKMVFLDAEKDGVRRQVEIDGRWEPMVDVELFHKVADEFARRSADPRNRVRKSRGAFPLTLTCAACGREYTGGRLSHAQGRQRVYSHTKPVEHLHPEAAKRFHEKGCKVWNVDAEELERKIRDLIVAERTSGEFEADIRELILERNQFRKGAAQAVEQSRKELARAERAYDRLVEIVKKTHGSEDEDDDSLVAAMKDAKAAVKEARKNLEEAERFARSKEDAWTALSGIISESRNLIAAWDRADDDGRKILFDYWVYDVMIVVEPIEGMKRANRKTAVVTLRTAPHSPKYFEMGGQLSAASADSISSDTQASSSTGDLARSALTASGEAIWPRAQAACPRTSGSGSDSAAVSTGTSSGAPALPSTTAALRRRPRNFARFMGEPLNAAENSDCDIASSSSASVRASLPATAVLGRYGEPSASSRANLRLNGHTS
ncbi:MAG TPA: recombinase family protein [Gemmatimonadaceae bacterium]|nr:recombinase family protein [Gemmatimonadaceae bacterium]